jgi:hypothetical protein
MRAFLLASSLLLLAPAGVAVNPLDDDAGSGGDAGDTPDRAVAVGMGSYAGTLLLGADLADWYRFEGRAGDVVVVDIRLAFQVTGTIFDPHFARYEDLFGSPVEQPVYLPEDGTWYLAVKHFPIPSDSEPLPYAFTLRLESGIVVASGTSHAGSQAAELRWASDAPTTLLLRATLPPEVGPATEPTVAFLSVAYEQNGAGPFWAALALYGSSLSKHVRVRPAVAPDVEVPLPGPATVPEELEATTPLGDAFGQYLFRFPAGTGSARIANYQTAGGATFRATMLSRDPVEHAFAGGGEPLAWSESNAGAEVQVLTPVASVTGARDLTLDLTRSFVGYFFVLAASGDVTAPDGTVTELGALDATFLVLPPPGTWKFHLDPSVGAAVATESASLTGLTPPELGVVGPYG